MDTGMKNLALDLKEFKNLREVTLRFFGCYGASITGKNKILDAFKNGKNLKKTQLRFNGSIHMDKEPQVSTIRVILLLSVSILSVSFAVPYVLSRQ